MNEYAYIKMDLDGETGQALILRSRLPQVGSRVEIKGQFWEVVEACYGFRLWNSIEGAVSCAVCA